MVRFEFRRSNGKAGRGKNPHGHLWVNLTIDDAFHKRALSTGIPVAYDKWDATRQRIRGESPYNTVLLDIADRITRIYSVLLRAGERPTLEAIRSRYHGTERPQPPQMATLAENWLAHRRAQAESGAIRRSTLTADRTAATNLLLFVEHNGPLTADAFGHRAAEAFVAWAKARPRRGHTGPLSHNSCAGVLGKIREMLEHARRQRLIESNPLAGWEMKTVPRREKGTVTETEVQMLLGMTVHEPDAALVRDVFCFCYYTCLAISDAWDFDERRDTVEIDGTAYLSKPRVKTEVTAFLPYHPTARLIAARHPGGFRPVATGPFNTWLQRILLLAGLRQRYITSHSARKSGIQRVWDETGSAAAAQVAAGHSSIRTTERAYARASPETARRVWERLQDS